MTTWTCWRFLDWGQTWYRETPGGSEPAKSSVDRTRDRRYRPGPNIEWLEPADNGERRAFAGDRAVGRATAGDRAHFRRSFTWMARIGGNFGDEGASLFRLVDGSGGDWQKQKQEVTKFGALSGFVFDVLTEPGGEFWLGT